MALIVINNKNIKVQQFVDTFPDLDDGVNINDIAVVKKSSGIRFINFKDAGVYIWNGTAWISDDNEIIDSISQNIIDISDKLNISDLSLVGSSNDYNDLDNLPTVTNGVDGDNAYDIAVNNGYIGTEADWLLSIEGTDGTDGADGQGVPVGGTTGQILSKIDNVNHNTQWVNPPTGGVAGNYADQAAFVLSQSLPGFPVTDGLTLGFIPSLSASEVDVTNPSALKVDAITDSGTGIQLRADSLGNGTSPDLKYSTANGLWYMETDGVNQGLLATGVDISKLISADGMEGSIVCISTLKQANQFNFGWTRNIGTNNWDTARRYGVHFPWGNGSIYYDFGASGGSSRLSTTQPAGMSNDTDIRTVVLTNGNAGQIINVDGVQIAQGSQSTSFSSGGVAVNETGALSFGCVLYGNNPLKNGADWSKMRCFAFLFFNRELTTEEIGKINEYKNRKIGFTY